MTSSDRMIKFIGIVIFIMLIVGLFEFSKNKEDKTLNVVENNTEIVAQNVVE